MRKLFFLYCFFLTACYSSKELKPLVEKISPILDNRYWTVEHITKNKVSFRYNNKFLLVKHIPTRAQGFTREMVYERKEERAEFILVLTQLPNENIYNFREQKRWIDLHKENPKLIVSKRDSVHMSNCILTIEDNFHGPQLVSGYLTIEDKEFASQLNVFIDKLYLLLEQPKSLDGWYNQRNELIKKSGTSPQD